MIKGYLLGSGSKSEKEQYLIRSFVLSDAIMIRSIPLICFLFSCSFLSNAQEIGVKLDLGASRFNFRQELSPNFISQYEAFRHLPVWSGSIGVYSRFEAGENFDFSVKLNYANKGNRQYTVFNSFNPQTPDSIYQTTIDVKQHMHYLGMEGLVHITKLKLFLGGQLSYLTRVGGFSFDQTKGTYNGIEFLSNSNDGKWTGEDALKLGVYNRLEFAAIIGYEYQVNQRMRLSLSYIQGVTTVLSDNLFINYRNSQLLFGVSYAIKKKKEIGEDQELPD